MTTRSRTLTVAWPEANARRTARQRLSRETAGPQAVSSAASSPAASPSAAVCPSAATSRAVAVAAGSMMGAHAQVLSAAELSLGLRVPGVTRTDVSGALRRGRRRVQMAPYERGQRLRPMARYAGSGKIEEVRTYEDGEPAWVAAGDTDFPAEPVRGVRLLPCFDAFTTASQPRKRLFAGAAYERALSGGQAGTFPVVVVNGTVAGVWHQRRSGRRVAVTVEPLAELDAARLRELGERWNGWAG